MSGTHPTGEPAPTGRALQDEVTQLQDAVRSQRDIGMAIGLLSARYGCSTEQAWRTMVRVSQDSNTKVRALARVLVTVHDGTADADEQQVLEVIARHLPPSGWPVGPGTGDDPVS